MKTRLSCLVAIVAIGALSLSGCKKDGEPETPGKPNGNEKMYLPTKIAESGEYWGNTYYKYAGGNYLVEIIYEQESGKSRSVITYDDALRPVKHESFRESGLKDRITLFTLNEKGQVVRGDNTYYDSDGRQTSGGYTLLYYNEKGQLITEENFSAAGIRDYVNTFSYDAAGNLLEIIDDEGYYTKVTYDDRNGAFKHVKNSMLFYVFGGADLEISSFYNNALTFAQPDGNVEFIYEYNAIDYPAKVIVKQGADDYNPGVMTFDYEEKYYLIF